MLDDAAREDGTDGDRNRTEPPTDVGAREEGVTIVDPWAAPPIVPNPPAVEHLGRYEVTGKIGHGGMGEVLRGRDPDLGRELALKVLLPECVRRPDLMRRFLEEAQIGGQLQHPGIVPVYELGRVDDRAYFTMKLVKGKTLAELLSTRECEAPAEPSSPGDSPPSVRVSPAAASDLPRFLSIFEAITQAMAYAHSRNVIHRDLKPLNIMVGAFGEVQVMDWGLAKVLRRGGSPTEPEAPDRPRERTAIAPMRGQTPPGSASDSETRHGDVWGTPEYMAPEQARGELDRIDERSDVFGLGAILLVILTGKPPFSGRSSAEIIRQASRGDLDEAFARLDAAASPLLPPGEGARRADEGSDVLNLQSALCSLPSAASVLLPPGEGARRADEGSDVLNLESAVLNLDSALCSPPSALPSPLDPELVSLCKSCLAPEPEDRPRHAGEVAQRMGAYLAGVQDRLRAAELSAAEARARAEEETKRRELADRLAASAKQQAALERSRRRVTAAFAGSVLLFVALAGAGSTWYAWRRQSRLAGLEQAVARVQSLCDSASSDPSDPDPWREAATAAAQELVAVGDLEGSEPARRLSELRAAAEKAAAAAEGDRRLLERLRDARSSYLALRASGVDAAYAGAFREYGLEVESLASGEGVRILGARSETFRRGLAHALDDWANMRRELGNARRPPGPILALSRALDPDPDPDANRGRLRALLSNVDLRGSRAELRALADAEKVSGLPPTTALLLASALKELGDGPSARFVLETSVLVHPDDTWLHYHLGMLHREAKPPRLDDAISQLSVARALNKDTTIGLADLLYHAGRTGDAASLCRGLIRAQPANIAAHYLLGKALYDGGDFRSAESEFRETVRLDAKHKYARLGISYARRGRGDLIGARDEFRRILGANQVYDLVMIFRTFGSIRVEHGDRGSWEEAAYREAIRLDPEFSHARYQLGRLRYSRGDAGGAEVEFREAIRLDPNHAGARSSLGDVLRGRGDLSAAAAEYREAIRLDPEPAWPHCNLGNVLRDGGGSAAAEVEYREAIALDADEPLFVLHRAINRISGGWSCNVADLRGVIDRKQWKGGMPLYAALVGYCESSLAGRFDEAGALLNEAAEKGESATWPMTVVQHLRGRLDEAALMTETGDDAGRLTEVRGYLGVEAICRGRKDEGRAHLDWVAAHGKKDFIEYGLALAVLRRLEAGSTPSMGLEVGLPEDLFARP